MIDTGIDADIPSTLLGDAVRIRQILNNLLSNAIKFTEQGQVNLRLSTRDEAGTALACSQVSDFAVGISESDRARLFERSYQVHPGNDGKQGAGLGLAICKHLAEMMSGRISVTSEVGLGSSFTLEGPMALGTEAPNRLRPMGPSSDATILVRGEPPEVVHSLVK